MFLVPLTRNAADLARSVDRLFDDGFERFFAPVPQGGQSATRAPALDVSESDGGYTVRIDLPGVTKDDVKVSIDGRSVNVEAQTRKDEEKKEGDRVVYRERSMSSFARSFTLASELDQAASSAKLENGVLTLSLTKRGAPASSRITVN